MSWAEVLAVMFAPKASSPLRPAFAAVETGSGAEETDALEFAALGGVAFAGEESDEDLFVFDETSPGITGGGTANASNDAAAGSFSFRLCPDVPVDDAASGDVASDGAAVVTPAAEASNVARAVFAASGRSGPAVFALLASTA
jgi:hypothetical protein